VSKAAEQWHRVLRFRDRYATALAAAPVEMMSFTQIPPDRSKEIGHWSRDCQDWAVACCQNLQHLKDWVAADPEAPVDSPDAEAHIDAHPALCVVADICNGTKHAELTRHIRTDIAEPENTGKRMSLSSTRGDDGRVTVAASHFVVVGGEKRELLAVRQSPTQPHKWDVRTRARVEL
jgi:hypothetical protein